MNKKKKITEDLIEANARLQAVTIESIYRKGNNLAKREGYESLEGIEAVQYYLIQKHNWTPSQVKSMSNDDLSFCLEEESL